MAEMTLDVAAEVRRLDPPEARDREVFEAVVGRGRPQDEVARQFGVSQPRVSQIVAHVKAWLAAATDEEAGELPPEQQLRYGQRIVRMRLDGLLSITMDSFRESKGLVPGHKKRDGESGRVVEDTLTASFGDVKYLTHYRHVALAIARLDGVNVAPRQPADRPASPSQESARLASPACQVDSAPASPAPAPATVNEPELLAQDLSAALQEILARAPAAPTGLPANSDAASTSALPPKRKAESPQSRAEQKNAYKQARRQAFLRGAPPAASAVAS